MTQPRVRSSGADSGCPSRSSAYGRKPSTVPTAYRWVAGSPASSAAWRTGSANRSCAMSTLAPESATIHAISGATKWWLTGTR